MAATTGLDPLHLRHVFGAFPTGVTAVAAQLDGAPVGIVASSFTAVSLDPPLASVCVSRTSGTWSSLRGANRLGVSVLGAQQSEACRKLAVPTPDRFALLTWRATAGGAIMIDGAAAWLECSVEHEILAGDHDIVILRIHELAADDGVAPLVFHRSRFRGLQP